MRRLLAILLLATFGLPVAAQALALSDSPDTHLPACCRRTGKHHCAMNMGKPAGTSLVSSICPSFPRTASTAPVGTLIAFTSSASALVPTVADPAPSEYATLELQFVYKHSHPKRGPPSLLL